MAALRSANQAASFFNVLEDVLKDVAAHPDTLPAFREVLISCPSQRLERNGSAALAALLSNHSGVYTRHRGASSSASLSCTASVRTPKQRDRSCSLLPSSSQVPITPGMTDPLAAAAPATPRTPRSARRVTLGFRSPTLCSEAKRRRLSCRKSGEASAGSIHAKQLR
eukprot:TRINITY_DN10110_c0_g1_i3.p1 TRINITY_DN10110_c0_g1~~TRINITY_DN10110_c0_g1_i3.p1  ORF type:complete len:167 (+),score=8.71 TRINITY_DN10110_c0_g1_i3:58-558(+)